MMGIRNIGMGVVKIVSLNLVIEFAMVSQAYVRNAVMESSKELRFAMMRILIMEMDVQTPAK